MVSLASWIATHHKIPPAARGDPWFNDGNIILVTHNRAFKFFKDPLTHQSEWFIRRFEEMTDDSVEMIDDCPVLPLEDTSQDFSSFLHALDDDGGVYFPLESDTEFNVLAGILLLATKYGAETMRAKALSTMETRFPSTLGGWDQMREASTGNQWRPDRILAINLVREVEAFSILPTAMASLTNDTSAGEIFGVFLHPNTPQRRNSHQLNPIDARHFAVMKEFNHVSIVIMLKFIRGIGRDCTRPPQQTPSMAGKAPVGAKVLQPRASRCHSTFSQMASMLLELLVLENPVGYADFVVSVSQMKEDKTHMCKICWKTFETGYTKKRNEWWNKLPSVLGFEAGWNDIQLERVHPW